ncbi:MULTISPECIES: Panacea domain-containing protein [Acinetobacter]|uniref:Panacea domain-containing protein n=1 Tax=Acinetobacter TaxID=469 RepID=UPI00281489D6|nr:MULTISPECIES: Panacea domain-containing protein [Acinetobacter]MDQ9887247.1 Panacea domain-containing protein [Acinetobacter pittii]MDS7983841.1 Panacea domain-containing protein [Acinetobacter sp. V104_3]
MNKSNFRDCFAMDNIFLFDEKKLTEATIFFLLQSDKHSINILKLMKLLYLSERKSFEMFHTPMIGDSLVSMNKGPVLSMTLERINHGSRKQTYWDKFISDRANNDIALKQEVTIQSDDDLLELSDNDITVLKQIWFEFGNKNQWELVDYTHDYCPEWRNPGSSMYPIEYKDLFKALGFSEELSNEIIGQLETQAYINQSVQMVNNH